MEVARIDLAATRDILEPIARGAGELVRRPRLDEVGDILASVILGL